MKKYFFCLLTVFIFGNIFISAAEEASRWRDKRSTHFIVYYKNAPEDFIDRVIATAEDDYNKIADNLGFTRFDFWLWENRAKIYIYDDAKDYRVSTGMPEWSSGYATVKGKTIYTFPGAKNFLNTVLPHEMGHIIFREFVGFNNFAVPTWLDEGVASYQENTRYSMRAIINDAFNQGKFISLQGLFGLNPQLMQDNYKVGLFYAEAVAIVDYLIREFGKDNFIVFCQNLRDRKNLVSSLSSVYPFNNIQEMDEAWQKHLKE